MSDQTRITTIDAKSHALILAKAREAITKVLGEYGLTVKQTGTSTRDMDGSFLTVKYTVTVAGDGTAPVGMEALNFTRYAPMEGMDPAWLGKRFMHPQIGEVEIVGYRPKARKNPILVKHTKSGSGKVYVITIASLKAFAVRAGWKLPEHWTNTPARLTETPLNEVF